MRSTFLAVAAALLVGVVTPAFAAGKHHHAKYPSVLAVGKHDYAKYSKPSYMDCEALAVRRGVPPGQGSTRNPDDQHNAFVRECLAGKIPF
jgi:hypothetical protein